MNRQINYRAWVADMEQMWYLSGFEKYGPGWATGQKDLKFIKLLGATGGFTSTQAHNVDIMESTGTFTVYDRNLELFRGDIVKSYRRDDKGRVYPVISEVTYLNGCYMMFNCTFHEYFRLWQSDWEIMGNIYQHKHLLKKQNADYERKSKTRLGTIGDKDSPFGAKTGRS